MKIRESLLTQIWRRQLINKDTLLTAEGERVQVLHPGRINDDSGPDFSDAIISIGGGMPLKGKVELHVRSSEWRSHKHHMNPGYNGVILHVVMWNNKDETSPLHSGERVPILALYPYLNESLEELSQLVQSPFPACEPCNQTLERYGEKFMAELLDKAGEERFYSKAEQFRVLLDAEEADQVLYEGVMRALGYAKNKESFERLARILPLKVLEEFTERGNVCILQALMLGIAGLLPSQRYGDTGGSHYPSRYEVEVDRLERIWESLDIGGEKKILNWRFFRVRPENYPPRRIAGASYLLSRYEEKERLMDMMTLIGQAPLREVQKKLERGFVVMADGYWVNHFDFGLESRRNPSLIGLGRARDIIVNIILPFSFAWAEKVRQPLIGERAIELYRRYPLLGDNWITRYMKRQISREYPARFIDSACKEQGLLHLYKCYCEDHRCPECPLYLGGTTGHCQETGAGYFFNTKTMKKAKEGV